MREVYVDHAGTTPPDPRAVAAAQPYLGAAFGNASSVHRRGEAARDAIAEARAKVARLLGAMPEEIVFTATGSEANNLALKGVLAAAPPGRTRLVISTIEHPSVLEAAAHLESQGTPVTRVGVDAQGIVDLSALEECLADDVALVSIMWVNNEVGTLQPIADIARLVAASGARFHCDAVQAVGKTPMGVEGIDLLSIAGHKFHGLLGAAALYVRRRTRLLPLVHGGHQERGRRAGTENLPAIVAMGAAADLVLEGGAGRVERIAALGERLEKGLLERIPGVRVNGHLTQRARCTVNVHFPRVDGEAALHELDRQGVTVSTGSACSAAEPGPSHVLLAMGRSPEEAHASVRFSFGATNTEADVDRILEVTPGVIARLRELDTPAATRSA